MSAIPPRDWTAVLLRALDCAGESRQAVETLMGEKRTACELEAYVLDPAVRRALEEALAAELVTARRDPSDEATWTLRFLHAGLDHECGWAREIFLVALARREEWAVVALHLWYEGPIAALCRREGLDSAAEAESLAHDLCEDFIPHAGGPEARAKFPGYLERMAKNATYKRFRKVGIRRRGKTKLAAASAPEPHDPESLAVERDLRQKLAGCMTHLDERAREVLRLAFFEGLTLHEIGGRFDRSHEWARQTKKKALAQLRECLDDGRGA